MNKKIKANYDDIKNKYQGQLNGLPGFVDINIALICPNGILDIVEREKEMYKHKKYAI